MLNFLTQETSFCALCRKRLHVLFFLVLNTFMCSFSFAQQASRAPASYVPDDDAIVTPVENKISLYQKYIVEDKHQDVTRARNQIRQWNNNQKFAEQYGLSTTLAGTAFFVPTPEQKFAYFKSRYMRYLTKKGEEPLRSLPKEWYDNFRASNEVDTIDEMERIFREKNGFVNQTANNLSQTSTVSESDAKKFGVMKNLIKKTKFIFQPRIEQGLVVVGMRGPIANIRAWIGVNGETEVNIQKTSSELGLRFMFNYYAHSQRYFSSIDKRIFKNLTARLISENNPEKQGQNNTLMLFYAKRF